MEKSQSDESERIPFRDLTLEELKKALRESFDRGLWAESRRKKKDGRSGNVHAKIEEKIATFFILRTGCMEENWDFQYELRPPDLQHGEDLRLQFQVEAGKI